MPSNPQGSRQVPLSPPSILHVSQPAALRASQLSQKTHTMDPFSSEVELVDLLDHFAAGRWQEVVDYDTSSLSPENKIPAQVLALRAKVTLGDAQEVLAELKGDVETPELQIVKVWANYVAGKKDAAVNAAEALATSSPDNATVQVLAATILQGEGKTEEALALLSKHQGNCKPHLSTNIAVPATNSL